MSKRCKFVFVTWVGPSVSVMKKAKMSTDKALMKDIIQVRPRTQLPRPFKNYVEGSLKCAYETAMKPRFELLFLQNFFIPAVKE